MSNSLSETKVVELTSGGRGAVAVLLVTGPEAVEIVSRLFKPIGQHRLRDLPPGRIRYGRWRDSAGEDVVVVCGEAGGRPQVEIHCHGGSLAPQAIVGDLVKLGCTESDWRGWVRDLADDPIQAEARVALAGASTSRTAHILMDQYHGALRREVEAAMAVANFDQQATARAQVEQLLGRAALGTHLTKPWKIVLAGPPNVGKSSLINALAGYNRAIVSDIAGTTRDRVTVTTAIDGWPVELSDTAGIHSTMNEIERQGIAIARAAMRDADLVLWIDDAQSPAGTAELRSSLGNTWTSTQSLQITNKADLASTCGNARGNIRTSARTGEGIDELIVAISGSLVPNPPTANIGVPFTIRQQEALVQASARLASSDVASASSALATMISG